MLYHVTIKHSSILRVSVPTHNTKTNDLCKVQDAIDVSHVDKFTVEADSLRVLYTATRNKILDLNNSWLDMYRKLSGNREVLVYDYPMIDSMTVDSSSQCQS